MKGSGAKDTPAVVTVENAAQCEKNSSNQKVLPNGSVWLTDLMSKVWHLLQRLATGHSGIDFDTHAASRALRQSIATLLSTVKYLQHQRLSDNPKPDLEKSRLRAAHT